VGLQSPLVGSGLRGIISVMYLNSGGNEVGNTRLPGGGGKIVVAEEKRVLCWYVGIEPWND